MGEYISRRPSATAKIATIRRKRRNRIIVFAILALIMIISCGAMLWWLINHSQKLNNVTLQESPTGDGISEYPGEDVTVGDNSLNKISRLQAELPDRLHQLDIELGLSGGDITISLIDLESPDYNSYNYNGDKQLTSASTYKLFIAYAMVHEIETGERTWSSPLNGTTYEACLEQMIVNSDNYCPEAYIGIKGNDYINSLADSLGVSPSTEFAYYDMRTSANDLALFLRKLYNDELMSTDNKEK